MAFIYIQFPEDFKQFSLEKIGFFANSLSYFPQIPLEIIVLKRWPLVSLYHNSAL